MLSFKNYNNKVLASSLLESVLAMVIIVICMTMAITLITKLGVNKVRIGDLEMIQNINSVQHEIELGSEKKLFRFNKETIKVIRIPIENSLARIELNVYNSEDELIYLESFIIEKNN